MTEWRRDSLILYVRSLVWDLLLKVFLVSVKYASTHLVHHSVGYILGHSVCCHVHGFEPYFYISCPPGMGPDDISLFHQTLEVMHYINSPVDTSAIWSSKNLPLLNWWWCFRLEWRRWIGTVRHLVSCAVLNWCKSEVLCTTSSKLLNPFLKLLLHCQQWSPAAVVIIYLFEVISQWGGTSLIWSFIIYLSLFLYASFNKLYFPRHLYVSLFF